MNLSPEQMQAFQEMMKDPAKRAQMEKMAQGMGREVLKLKKSTKIYLFNSI